MTEQQQNEACYVGYCRCGEMLSTVLDNPKHAEDVQEAVNEMLIDGLTVYRTTLADARQNLSARGCICAGLLPAEGREPEPVEPGPSQAQVLADLLAALKAWEAWEAAIITTDAVWGNGASLPTITQELWDALIPLQEMRNAAIAQAETAQKGAE